MSVKYDLQEKYTEKIVDFVRHADENEVYKFLQTISELHSYDDFKILDKEIYFKSKLFEEKYSMGFCGSAS